MNEINYSQYEELKPRVRRRNGIVVGVLSFFMSGLGHVYIGEARRGILLFLGETVLSAFFFKSTIAFSIAGLVSFLCVFLVYRIFVIADSVLINRKKDSFELKGYNRFLAYAGFVLLATLISATAQFNDSRIEAFKIPSPSMVPTFLIGDHIMVDKWAYGKARPHRGDLMVFRYPRSPEIDFIKRCVAVEGDVVEIQDKVLYINGAVPAEPYAIFTGEGRFFYGRDDFGPYTVPDGKLFVLGDNRDNSSDSRYWGPVDADEVIGRVRVIYWSWDREKKKVRWDRIGMKFE